MLKSSKLLNLGEKMKDERMSSPLPAEALIGLSLDWAVGIAAGFKLRFVQAGESINGIKWAKPHIFRYVDVGSISDSIKKFPVLEIFKPTEDWEHLPGDYKQSYDYVAYTAFSTTKGSGTGVFVHKYDGWMAHKVYCNDGSADPSEGNTKLEAICRAYVSYKLTLVSIPAIIIESDVVSNA